MVNHVQGDWNARYSTTQTLKTIEVNPLNCPTSLHHTYSFTKSEKWWTFHCFAAHWRTLPGLAGLIIVPKCANIPEASAVVKVTVLTPRHIQQYAELALVTEDVEQKKWERSQVVYLMFLVC